MDINDKIYNLEVKHNQSRSHYKLTSGSYVSLLVCIRIFPILTSFDTETKASSSASPALRIDTPQI